MTENSPDEAPAPIRETFPVAEHTGTSIRGYVFVGRN